MRLGCEWRHVRKRWAGNFGDFEKKQLVEIEPGDASWDSTLGEASWDILTLGQFSWGVDWRAMLEQSA